MTFDRLDIYKMVSSESIQDFENQFSRHPRNFMIRIDDRVGSLESVHSKSD